MVQKKGYSKQDFIDIAVSYIDDYHKEKLSTLPYRQPAIENLRNLTTHPPFRVLLGDFLVYAMFRDLGSNTSRFKNLETIQNNVKDFDVEFGDYFEINNGRLTKIPGTAPPNHITEALGVAIGLLVISKLHDLTLADWTKIPRLEHKHLDFELASDGQQTVQVETKGTIAYDNSLKSGKGSGSVAHHKAGIAAKKREVRRRTSALDDDFPALIRYGTIASLDAKNNVRCWVLDPPASDTPGMPRALRIIKRMAFLGRIIDLISPRSALAKKLDERLREMTVENVESFNRKRLDVDQELDRRRVQRGDQNMVRNFFSGQGRKGMANSVGGVVVSPPGTERGIFVGLDLKLMALAIEQDQTALLDYRAEEKTHLRETVSWGPLSQRENFEVDMHYSSSGVAIGIGSAPDSR